MLLALPSRRVLAPVGGAFGRSSFHGEPPRAARAAASPEGEAIAASGAEGQRGREADALLELVDVLGVAPDQLHAVAQDADEAVAVGRLGVADLLAQRADEGVEDGRLDRAGPDLGVEELPPLEVGKRGPAGGRGEGGLRGRDGGGGGRRLLALRAGRVAAAVSAGRRGRRVADDGVVVGVEHDARGRGGEGRGAAPEVRVARTGRRPGSRRAGSRTGRGRGKGSSGGRRDAVGVLLLFGSRRLAGRRPQIRRRAIRAHRVLLRGFYCRLIPGVRLVGGARSRLPFGLGLAGRLPRARRQPVSGPVVSARRRVRVVARQPPSFCGPLQRHVRRRLGIAVAGGGGGGGGGLLLLGRVELGLDQRVESVLGAKVLEARQAVRGGSAARGRGNASTHGDARIGADAGAGDDDDLTRLPQRIGNVLQQGVASRVDVGCRHAGGPAGSSAWEGRARADGEKRGKKEKKKKKKKRKKKEKKKPAVERGGMAAQQPATGQTFYRVMLRTPNWHWRGGGGLGTLAGAWAQWSGALREIRWLLMLMLILMLMGLDLTEMGMGRAQLEMPTGDDGTRACRGREWDDGGVRSFGGFS